MIIKLNHQLLSIRHQLIDDMSPLNDAFYAHYAHLTALHELSKVTDSKGLIAFFLNARLSITKQHIKEMETFRSNTQLKMKALNLLEDQKG